MLKSIYRFERGGKMNNVLKDKSLSFKAKGIYYQLTSMKKAERNVSDLASLGADGDASFRSGWNELRDKGYIKIIRKNEDGVFKWEIEVLK